LQVFVRHAPQQYRGRAYACLPGVPQQCINTRTPWWPARYVGTAYPTTSRGVHHTMHSSALIRTATAALALGALAACSSTPAPNEQMAVTRTTVNRVAAAPAVATSAPVQLQQAREKLMQAEKAMAEKDYVAARRLAAEAEVDARVAETRADAASNAANFAQVQDGIRALQEEINRRSPR